LSQSLVSVRLRSADLALLAIYYTTLSLLHGVALAMVIRAMAGENTVPLAAAIAASALAWLVGYLAVFAPSGIVIREAALATMLSTWLTPGMAFGVAVTMRGLQILAELLLLALVASRRALRGTPPREHHST
jgi:hypothetical protein